MRLVSYSCCCLPSTFCSCSVYILSCAPSHQSKARGDELYARTLRLHPDAGTRRFHTRYSEFDR